MIVKITYDQNSEELLQLKKDFPNVKFEFYNDDYYKEQFNSFTDFFFFFLTEEDSVFIL